MYVPINADLTDYYYMLDSSKLRKTHLKHQIVNLSATAYSISDSIGEAHRLCAFGPTIQYLLVATAWADAMPLARPDSVFVCALLTACEANASFKGPEAQSLQALFYH